MSNKRIENLLSFAQHTFFNKIGTKFRSNLLKNFMDLVFVIFEKIGYKYEIISSNYLKLYDEIVGGEINLSNASSKDIILVVGCGSLPATTALIATKTNAEVIAIDKNPKAVDDANRFVKNLNINNIKIEHANGLNYSIRKFDVIFLLFGLKHKEEILNNFAKSMKDSAKIIFRMPSDIKEEDKKKILNKFIIKDCRRSKTLGSVDSYLLEKKKSKLKISPF